MRLTILDCNIYAQKSWCLTSQLFGASTYAAVQAINALSYNPVSTIVPAELLVGNDEDNNQEPSAAEVRAIYKDRFSEKYIYI